MRRNCWPNIVRSSNTWYLTVPCNAMYDPDISVAEGKTEIVKNPEACPAAVLPVILEHLGQCIRIEHFVEALS